MEACHRDDDKKNNHLNNLYWGTHRQNFKDAKRNGIIWGLAKLSPRERSAAARLRERNKRIKKCQCN
jgi:hypothetical protein